MNCLRCELARAKVKALALYSVGISCDRIAERLSASYGENYYARAKHGPTSDVWTVERLNKLPPYEPFIILEKELPKCNEQTKK